MDLAKPTDTAIENWAAEQFRTLACGDERRQRRLQRVAGDFMRKPGVSIPEACGDWAGAKACYRLFDCGQLRFDPMLASLREATHEKLRGEEAEDFLLVVQDTTSLNFSTRTKLEGLGPTGSLGEKKTPGLLLHSHLAIGEDGEVHGLVGARLFARQGRQGQAAGKRNRQRVEEKESGRWLEGWSSAQGLWEALGGRRKVLAVGDRESDIWELLAAALRQRAEAGDGAGLLIRSQHDRRLEAAGGQRLWQTPEALPVRAQVDVEIPRGKNGLQTRKVVLEVRAGLVRLEVPEDKRKYLGHVESLAIWAMEAVETDPPPGVEAVCWRLLCTEEIRDATDARRMVACYARRWMIEMWHRVLKSGCRVERRQLGDIGKLKAFIALDMAVATRLLELTMRARLDPSGPSGQWLQREEWEALSVHAAGGGPPPANCPTNAAALGMIARLGGFLGRKGDGPPGTQVLWRGLTKLAILTDAWLVFRSGKCG